MKAAEIRAKTERELVQVLREERQKLVLLRLKKESGQLEKSHQLSAQRKTIATLLLVLAERRKTSSGAR